MYEELNFLIRTFLVKPFFHFLSASDDLLSYHQAFDAIIDLRFEGFESAAGLGFVDSTMSFNDVLSEANFTMLM